MSCLNGEDAEQTRQTMSSVTQCRRLLGIDWSLLLYVAVSTVCRLQCASSARCGFHCQQTHWSTHHFKSTNMDVFCWPLGIYVSVFCWAWQVTWVLIKDGCYTDCYGCVRPHGSGSHVHVLDVRSLVKGSRAAHQWVTLNLHFFLSHRGFLITDMMLQC